MHISKFTDYAFRSLIYLAINDDKLCKIDEMAKDLFVSENHIKKIVHKLAKGNFIKSIKGRTGGIKLAMKPEDINLSSVILYCDEISNVIDCKKNNNLCCYYSNCKLKNIIYDATEVFKNEFEKYTLKDLIN